MKKSLILGIAGSFFFAFTFILNRSMNLGGGDWMWSAALRYLFTLPMTAVLILLGIFLMQIPNLENLQGRRAAEALIPIVSAAFSYPLGNRKMMEVCENRLNTFQRVFGMTLCSMPFWLILSAAAYGRVGLPSQGQTLQSVCVALFSGVIATVLFFRATDLVRHDQKKLALIEATQCGEVLFTLLGGILILGDSVPAPVGFAGILLIVAGMVLNSLVAA